MSALPTTMSFGPLTIEHDESVLRPRPWTTLQSAWAAELLSDLPPGPVLELCTGAGHIGLLAAHLSGRHLVAVDLSPSACDLAQRNSRRAKLEHLVEVRNSDLSQACRPDETFVLVIADPPWVRSDRTGDFPEDPLLAIDGGPAGLDVAHRCLDVAAAHLAAGGQVLLQLGGDEQVEPLVTSRWREVARRRGERGLVVQLELA
ncbi:MAG: class I SAM-dependent methyltransferase [Nocardioides sp.]